MFVVFFCFFSNAVVTLNEAGDASYVHVAVIDFSLQSSFSDTKGTSVHCICLQEKVKSSSLVHKVSFQLCCFFKGLERTFNVLKCQRARMLLKTAASGRRSSLVHFLAVEDISVQLEIYIYIHSVQQNQLNMKKGCLCKCLNNVFVQ